MTKRSPSPIRFLTCCAILLAFHSAPAQEETVPLAPAPPTSPTESAWQEMARIVELAPSRQPGQPGNEWVDEWIRERLSAAAHRQNPADRRAEVERLEAAVAEAEAAYLAAWDNSMVERRPDLEQERDTRQAHSTVLIIRLFTERRDIPVYFLLAILIMLMTAWWFQRRKAYLVAGGVTFVLIVAIPLSAWILRSGQPHDMEDPETPGTATPRQLQAALEDAAGHLLKADTELATALEGLWVHGRMEFPTAAFLPGEGYLSANSREIRIYQMAPNLVDPGNFPELEFAGPLVYVGRGSPAELSEVDLDGALAVMEFESDDRWINVAELGAEGVILLEPEDPNDMIRPQATRKMTISPVNVPRWYAEREAFLELIGASAPDALQAGLEARLTQEPGVWERVELHNDWLLIPPAGVGAGELAEVGSELVHIQAYKDSASIVPELAPGAGGAANLVALVRLVEHFEEHPPSRPVLISVVNDHTNTIHGEMQFATMAFSNQAALLEELERLTRMLAQKEYVQAVFSRPPTEAIVNYLRAAIERIGGRSFTVKEPAVDYLMMHRNNLREAQGLLEVRAQALELEIFRGEGTPGSEQRLQELRAEIADIEAQAEAYIRTLGLFNRFGHRTEYEDLDDEGHADLKHLFETVSAQAGLEAQLLRNDRERLLAALTLRRQLMALSPLPDAGEIGAVSPQDLTQRRYPVIPALAAVCLDLRFGSNRLGFFTVGDKILTPRPDRLVEQRVGRLARFFAQTIGEGVETGALPDVFQPTLVGAGGLPPATFQGCQLAFGSYAFHTFAIAGVSLSSTNDLRIRGFTPMDTPEHLDRDNFDDLFAFTETFLPMMVNHPDLAGTRQTRGTPNGLSLEVTVRQMDRFSVELPKTVMPSALISGMISTRAREEYARTFDEVRPYPTVMADAAGRLTLRGAYWRGTSAQAFHYNEDYTMLDAALDLESSERRFSSTFDIGSRTDYAYRSLVTFEARKIDLIGLRRPLNLDAVEAVEMIDGRSDTTPRHYGVSGVESATSGKSIPLALDATASVFTEPHVPFKLEVEGSLLIHTTPDDLVGIGFSPDARILKDLALVSATDMSRLADERLEVLASRGVISDAANQFAARANENLEKIETEAMTAGERLLWSEVARGLAYRAYSQAIGITRDLVQAVVVLLALVVPFCFFLMKLVTPYTEFGKQVAIFIVIFILMTIALYLIQPAFHVGEHPEVVILGFIILGMAAFVASVIIGRFNASMNQAIEESQSSDSADAPQGRLAGVAFMVGVNNMRRRRIRTTLTSATIVLVTFTILSVISIGHDTEPLRLRLSAPAPYSGVLYTAPGMAPIDNVRMERLQAHFGEDAETLRRTWTFRQDAVTGSYLPYFLRPREPLPQAPMSELTTLILLGLETGEDGFLVDLSAAPYMVEGGRWFSSNDAREIILSRRAASLLGISPYDFKGQEIILFGEALTLVGLLNDEAFEEVDDLRSTSLLPLLIDPSAELGSDDAAAETVDLAELPGVRRARPTDIAMLPLGFARELDETSYRTLSVKYNPGTGETMRDAAARCWRMVARFLEYQDAYLTVSLAEPVERGEGLGSIERGQYAMASSGTAEIGGVLKVAIPVILAATIILNTMLGSVMERRREISIYNAIGLNPSHVMVFFLAESLVFGLVGSVAGYFIGQFLSIILSQFIAINLNYSSLAVMVVIFMTIGTVLLSTLYPAMMAARAAVPSGQRRWSLPKPDGDEIHLRFPFSYDANRVLGVCSWLNDYMEQNSEASTGKFLAKAIRFGLVPSAEGEEGAGGVRGDGKHYAYSMVYDVAPPPFDLGVNQKMEVYADYDPIVKAHMLSVHLTRLTGDFESWLTVNQTFLEHLRKRLLNWRSQKAETQSTYFEQGKEMFRDAQVLPVREETVPAEETR